MTPIALVPEEFFLTGVSVVAWPDNMDKSSRCGGTLTKIPDPKEEGKFQMILKLRDKRTFVDPIFPMLAD